MRRALGRQLGGVAHCVAGLERAQLDVRRHRIQREARVGSTAVVLERVEQGHRAAVDAEKLKIREVREVAGAEKKLLLEGAHAEFEARPWRRAGVGMNDRGLERRLR